MVDNNVNIIIISYIYVCSTKKRKSKPKLFGKWGNNLFGRNNGQNRLLLCCNNIIKTSCIMFTKIKKEGDIRRLVLQSSPALQIYTDEYIL